MFLYDCLAWSDGCVLFWCVSLFYSFRRDMFGDIMETIVTYQKIKINNNNGDNCL